MPLNESAELAAIRQVAQFVTDTRTGAALLDKPAVTIFIDTLRTIEQQLWTAYALACEAEARREQRGA